MPYYDVRYDPDEGKVVAVLVDENGRSKVSMASIYHRDVVGNLVPNAPNPVNVSGSAGGSSGGGVGNIIFPTTSMPNNPFYNFSTLPGQAGISPIAPPTNTVHMSTAASAPVFEGTVVYFLVLDGIPQHIQDTFGFDDNGQAPTNQYAKVIRMGDEVTLSNNLEFAVIIYNASDWHANEALELKNQLNRMFPQVKILSLPVKG